MLGDKDKTSIGKVVITKVQYKAFLLRENTLEAIVVALQAARLDYRITVVDISFLLLKVKRRYVYILTIPLGLLITNDRDSKLDIEVKRYSILVQGIKGLLLPDCLVLNP